MIEFRPHILTWETTTEATQSPEGYPIPGTTTTFEVPCRWHSQSAKTFRNEDSQEVAQKGRIRVDIGSPIPEVGQLIEVLGHFKGIVQEVYKGGTISSWRIDV